MAQRSADGVGKTSEMSGRLERAKAIWTRSAISIQASSRDDGCINRPDTRKHLNPRNMPSKTSCIQRGVHTRTLARWGTSAPLRQFRTLAPQWKADIAAGRSAACHLAADHQLWVSTCGEDNDISRA